MRLEWEMSQPGEFRVEFQEREDLPSHNKTGSESLGAQPHLLGDSQLILNVLGERKDFPG